MQPMIDSYADRVSEAVTELLPVQYTMSTNNNKTRNLHHLKQ